MPRIAPTYFLIEASVESISEQQIPLEAVEFAIEWCKHLEAHAKKLWAPTINPALVPARALGECISAGKVQSGISLSTIQQNNWSKLTTPADVRLAADQLETWGWLQLSVIETNDRPSTVIRLNPEILIEV